MKTVDGLASTGIITPRPKAVRILPDVLSDYLLEDCCINQAGRSTHYADRVYEHFGAHSLKNLMRNLAELDWRRGQSEEIGLNLLDRIWADINKRFRIGNEHARHGILESLADAAIYQPDHIIRLVRFAIDHPIQVEESQSRSQYRMGQEYVLSALPSLLEATAYHPERLRESVATLWELTKSQPSRGVSARGSENVLKRLSSWHRLGDPVFNFAMLVEAIRLAKRTDAFTSEFTPFAIIKQILAQEGEFNEWQSETTFSFGGFELNYTAVGPVRESALDYLEYALHSDGNPALHAVSIMKEMLHKYLNRISRKETDQENSWQQKERDRCLQALVGRFHLPGSALLKAKIYDALRAGTGINCPEPTRDAAAAALDDMAVDDAVAVVDAICTAEHNLPLVTTELSEADWEHPITELMLKGRNSLERLITGEEKQAYFTIEQIRACMEVGAKTEGFGRFMLAFADRPGFLAEMAEQLIAHPHVEEMLSHLSSVLSSIHHADPPAFRDRALSALKSGKIHVIHAAANNLRVFEGATEEDIAVIRAYAGYPDPVAKRGAIFAISYMGKFTELRQSLKEVALSIRTEGDEVTASKLVKAFGPYGVPLTSLTRKEAANLASEFLFVHNWDFEQGTIPDFLNRFVTLFPDETYELLLQRIEQGALARQRNERRFRSFGLVHQDISFSSVPNGKRLELGKHCISRLVKSEFAVELSDLFWNLAGYDEPSLQLVVEISANLDERGVNNIAKLIEKAVPSLAFANTNFAKALLCNFEGEQREQIVKAFASQAVRLGHGLVYVGNPDDYMAQRTKQFAANVAALPDEAGLEDLANKLRKFT